MSRQRSARAAIAAAALAFHISAHAETVAKDPLSYPLKQYGFMLGVALFGGLVSWLAKVKKGQLHAWNVMHLVGELATSAFAGLLAFWLCEAAGLALSWTVPLVGIAGHMGTRAITEIENRVQKRFGASPDGDDTKG